jgi:hypothetical protein
MKLPFTRDTTSRIEATRHALAAAEATIAKMMQERATAIVDSDDVAAVRKLDDLLSAEQRTTQILADRLVALEQTLVAESEQQRQRDYTAAVASLERLLPLRTDAAAEVESAILVLASAVQKFVQVSGSIVNQWPTDRLGTKPSWQLGTRAIGDLMRNCWANSAMIYSTTKQPAPAADFVRRAVTAHERAAGFADATRSDHAELIAGLRAHGAPAVEIDEEVGAA